PSGRRRCSGSYARNVLENRYGYKNRHGPDAGDPKRLVEAWRVSKLVYSACEESDRCRIFARKLEALTLPCPDVRVWVGSRSPHCRDFFGRQSERRSTLGCCGGFQPLANLLYQCTKRLLFPEEIRSIQLLEHIVLSSRQDVNWYTRICAME